MLQIRAKKLTEWYAVNVDYIDIDTYTDVLNMLCAINEEIVTTLHEDYTELFCKDCFESCPYYKIHG